MSDRHVAYWHFASFAATQHSLSLLGVQRTNKAVSLDQLGRK
jgi:hypothetical protein